MLQCFRASFETPASRAPQDEDLFLMASKISPHPERDPGLDPGEQSKDASRAIQLFEAG
jgi:hypothetical protein